MNSTASSELVLERVSTSAADVSDRGFPYRSTQDQFRQRIKEILALGKPLKHPRCIANLLGRTFDHLFVVSYGGSTLKENPRGRSIHIHRWVVRCECGEHEMRRIESLLKRHEGRMMCHKCHQKMLDAARFENIPTRAS